MNTIRDLITSSFRLLGTIQANEVPSPEDMDNAFDSLNSMLDSWSTEKLSIYSMNQYKFEFNPGQKEYTVGPGGDWDIDRPMEIVSLYCRYNPNT